MKSERLQKLEMELEVNESCMAAGLFPKREKERYLEEIRSIKTKIEEEKERLRIMKESGEGEEYVIPKRNLARQAYADPHHTLPDMDTNDGTDHTDLETDDFGGTTDHGTEDESTSSGEEESEGEEDTEREGGWDDGARIERLSKSSQDPDVYWGDSND